MFAIAVDAKLKVPEWQYELVVPERSSLYLLRVVRGPGGESIVHFGLL